MDCYVFGTARGDIMKPLVTMHALSERQACELAGAIVGFLLKRVGPLPSDHSYALARITGPCQHDPDTQDGHIVIDVELATGPSAN